MALQNYLIMQMKMVEGTFEQKMPTGSTFHFSFLKCVFTKKLICGRFESTPGVTKYNVQIQASDWCRAGKDSGSGDIKVSRLAINYVFLHCHVGIIKPAVPVSRLGLPLLCHWHQGA